MRKGLLVGGIVLLILGVAAAGFFTYLGQVPVSTNIKASHAGELSLSALDIGPQSATVTWSNALSSDTIYVTTSNPLTCSNPANQLAKGTGASGSFSLTFTPGTNYYIFDCSQSGTLAPVSISYTTLGINALTIGGIFFVVVGVVLIAVARKPKSTPPMMGGTMPTMGMPPSGPGGPPPSP